MATVPHWLAFKPHKNRLTKVLGDLEADVMEALWKLQFGHVKNIHEEVSRKRKVAVTTVATVLDRLYRKGLVERELKKGKGLYYEFRPTITKNQFEKTIVRSVLEGLFETFGDSVISYLVNDARIKDEKALEEIKHHLERLKREAK